MHHHHQHHRFDDERASPVLPEDQGKALRQLVEHAEQDLTRSQRRSKPSLAHRDVGGVFSPGARHGVSPSSKEQSMRLAEKHLGVATEHSLIAQVNQLQLQLDTSRQRAQLLERRLLERQQWISPRDVLDLWEELERDVEKLGVGHIEASTQQCKQLESEAYHRASDERKRNALVQQQLHVVCRSVPKLLPAPSPCI
jgi:hypothetical protein